MPDKPRPGELTDAEFGAWWAASRRRWREALCGPDPPGERERWAWVSDEIGWCRRGGGTGDAKARTKGAKTK